MRRVFTQFPIIMPATENGTAVYSKYSLKFNFPLQVENEKANATNVKVVADKNEFENMGYQTFDNPKFSSTLNIPFSHSYYAQFDDDINYVGANNHTASKPYTYVEVAKYYDFQEQNNLLKKDKKSWWGRKILNEDMIAYKTEDYWFTINPVFDLRLGKDTGSDIGYTYQNTRGLEAQGALGDNLFFTTTVFESQARFADYFNTYANSIQPGDGNPAIIPGIGIAKPFKKDSYDFPSANAALTYAPSKLLNLQMGYSRNFIGDGYRSLLTSDISSPYPYVKINTTFWKIKYTNTYAWLKDVRPEVSFDRTYATKYMANHYLSLNVNKRLNIGLFESVIWTNSNLRGFDMSFVNPLIFYRSVEFASSPRSGNATLGLTSKYKFSNSVNMYSQLLIDEFSISDIKAQEGSWKNKYGFQLGLKYYNSFGVKNLTTQVEYNMVRPFTYSHSRAITNYAHNNQSLGHLWGSNFREFVFIARYNEGRFFAEVKLVTGIKGLDFNTATDNLNYGSDLYKDYEESRALSKGVKIGQGNKVSLTILDFNTGYVVNPITNLKLFAGVTYRNFVPIVSTTTVDKQSTVWLTVGLRTDVFNFYSDF